MDTLLNNPLGETLEEGQPTVVNEGQPTTGEPVKTYSEKELQAELDRIRQKYSSELATTKQAYELTKAEKERLEREKMSEEQRKQYDEKMLREEIARLQSDALLYKNQSYASLMLNKRGLDNNLVDLVIMNAKNELDIDNNITRFETIINAELDKRLNQRINNVNRDSLGGNTPPPNASYTGANPFASATFNITEQMKLYSKDKELYERLKAQAEGFIIK